MKWRITGLLLLVGVLAGVLVWQYLRRFELRIVTINSGETFNLKLDERTGRTWLLYQNGPRIGWIEITNLPAGSVTQP